jgi:hypothetical protein
MKDESDPVLFSLQPSAFSLQPSAFRLNTDYNETNFALNSMDAKRVAYSGTMFPLLTCGA